MENEKEKDKKLVVGFAVTASFCTFQKVFPEVSNIVNNNIDVIPIMSENSYSLDTRFGTAAEHIEFLKNCTGNEVIHTIDGAEPIGPKKLLDALIIAPCTGNTLAKLANGIADTCVTLSAKSHLRNKRPIIVAVSSNDSLGNNAKNIGMLLNQKNIYFVPFRQDDCVNKENSIVAQMDLILPTLEYALKGKQIQPVLI